MRKEIAQDNENWQLDIADDLELELEEILDRGRNDEIQQTGKNGNITDDNSI